MRKAAEKKATRKAVKNGEKSHDIYGTGMRVQFGQGGKLPDWRKYEKDHPEVDPDDELLPETPADVVAILGFDPLEGDE